MDIGLLRLVRRLKDGEKLKFNRRLSVFMICLFISSLFWFLNSLSKKYTDKVSFPVTYTNLPEDKFLVNKLPEKITMNLHAQGYFLLASKFKLFNDTIKIDGNDLKYKNKEKGNGADAYYTSFSGIEKLQSQINPEVQILKVYPDSVFFYFGVKKTKVVPVKLNAMISFEKQYQMKGDVYLRPEAIKVQGPDFLVDSLELLETETINLEKLNNGITFEAKIALPSKFKNLELSSDKITATVQVEKYTEAEVDVPIDVANLPEGYTIKTFPEKVRITYLVAFSEFDKVDSSNFLVKADYAKQTGKNKLNIEIALQPEFVKIARITPSRIEYIVRKK